MKVFALLTLSVLALSACSTEPRRPDYECPLDDVAAAKCASMDQAYNASKQMSREDQSRVQSVFDRRVQKPATVEKPVFQGQSSNYPEPGQNGMPVFEQPTVARVWVAPYVDADGNLRSGEYTYFSTPGKWNYGDLKKPGEASGIIQPGKPSNLGFSATAVKPQAPATTASPGTPMTPTKPNDTGTTGQTSSTTPAGIDKSLGALSGAQSAGPADPATAITQPYQRLPK